MKRFFYILLFSPIFCFGQSNWTQQGPNINGEALEDESGISVGINSLGNRIAIGGYKNDGNGSNSGHVRIYEEIGGNWIQIGADIDGETMSDKFGKSVDLNSAGDRVVVGAWFAASASLPIGSGQISCYELSNGTWNQMGNYINGEASLDYFGISTAINASGSIIAGGAYHNDGLNGYNSGHVRVYEYIGGVWTQLGNDIDGEAPSDRCGWSVSLNSSGHRVAVGSPQNDGNGSNSGSARVYDWNGSIWSQVGSDIDGEAVGDHSGNSVSLNSLGNILAIGAIYNQDNGSNSGHVRVYELIGNSWVQIGGDIDGEAAIDESARSISLDSTGHKIVIGAHANDGNGNDSGHARIYQYLNGSWVQVGSDIDGENADDNCGRSVSLSASGNKVVIGSPKNDGNGSNSGHTRVYEFNNQLNTSIPDSIFEQRLIDLGYDTIHDGQVLTANIVNVDSLHLHAHFTSTVRISDLTGIEDFVNLTYLYCSSQHLTNLDLSQNPNLTHLICAGQYPWNSNIGLNNLNVSQNLNLTYLKCNSNELISLDISQNNQLSYLECRANNLTNLDISQNINLTFLDCNVNQLTSLDVSQNIALDTLDCSMNQISNLDFSQNTNLSYLDCQQNPLILSLDLTQNQNLNWVFLQNNQLISLDVRNGNNTNLFLRAENNPNLNCISVDDSVWAATNWNMIDNHTIFSNNCNNSFQYTAIPDSIFEQRLIDLGYDAIHDGQVLTASISIIDTLILSAPSVFPTLVPPHDLIFDFSGIQDFSSLIYFDCKWNGMTSLDLSNNPALQYLDCSGYWDGGLGGAGLGQLTNLNISQNSVLTYLNCNLNQITSLDVTQNTLLTELHCAGNQISSLDVTQNIYLTELSFGYGLLSNCGNNISNIDLSQNIALTGLSCSQNQLTSLDITNNLNLDFLDCQGNLVSDLNLSQNSNLLEVWARGNIFQNLDVRNGNNVNITHFDTRGNNSLYCVSVDDSVWASTNWTNIDSHTIFSNNCNSLQLYTLIPDTIFEQKLIDLGYDNVHDGQVLTSNIVNIDSLDVSHTVSFVNPPITDLTGLQDFTNLTYLDVSQNSLLYLDVSQNTLLKHLNCEGFFWNGNYSGALQNLDLSNNDSLTYLNCIGNMISNLDLSNNYALLKLYCSYNLIDTLNLSVNTALTHLNCSKNNQIRTLDLSQNSALVSFKCIGSTVFGIPLGKLQNLDIRNGNNINITTFNTSNNDSLYCISVDDSTWSANNWTNIDSVTSYSTDCNPSPTNIINQPKRLLIYPNPTNNNIQIEIKNFRGSFEAELYDVTGKLLETTNKNFLSLAKYQNGIYLLKVAYGDRVEKMKVIKD